MKRIIVIDYCNYCDYPLGGHLSFIKKLMQAFKDQLILVGITTEKEEPIGKWFSKEIDGVVYDYFALARYDKTKTKHLIPDRLACIAFIRYFRIKILEKKYHNVFVQRPEVLPAIKDFGYNNICYRFPGLENPLKTSKYRFARYFSTPFDKLFFSSLGNI